MEASKNVRHVQLSPPPACPTSSRLANTTFVAEGRGPVPPTSEDRSAATGLPCGVRRLVVWGLGLLAFSGLVMLWTSGSSERQSQQQQGKRKPSPSASPSSCPSARRAYSSKSTNTDGSPEPTIPSAPPSSSRQRDPPDTAAAVSPPSLTSSILACSSPKPPPPDATTVKDLPPPLMQLALVDQSLESIDRSGPLSLYTSLVAAPSPASELAIRRSVSWSEPYLSSDEHSDDDLLCSPTTITTNIVHRLDCTSDRKPSLREIAASDMPIFHTCCKTVDSDASSAPSSTISNGKLADSAAEKPKTDSHAADDHEQSYTTVTSQRCHGVNWTQVKIDLFLLICILSFLLYFFYFRSRQPARPKEIQIPKETVPFLLYRLLP